MEYLCKLRKNFNIKTFLKNHWMSLIAFLIGLICIIAMCGTWHQTAYYKSNSSDIVKTMSAEEGTTDKNSEFVIPADQIPENTDHLVLIYSENASVGIISNISFRGPHDVKDGTRAAFGYQPNNQNVIIIDLSQHNADDSICIPQANIDGMESIEFHSDPVTFRYLHDDFHWRKFLTAFLILIVATVAFDLMLHVFRHDPDKDENRVYRSLPYVFLVLILSIGMTMILKYPLARVELDLGTHYWYALSDSYMGDMRLTVSETSIGWLNNVPNISHSDVQNRLFISAMNNQPNASVFSYTERLSASRMPSGMGIALARMLGASFFIQFTMGKLFNLIFYALICFWALWYLKSGRFILMALMLTPGNLFLATNYEYDHWVLALIYLGIALMVGTVQRQKKVNWYQTMLITFTLLLAVIPKPVYAPVMLFPLLLRKNKVKKKTTNFIGWIIPIIGSFIIILLRARHEFSQGGDPRVANAYQAATSVDPKGQVYYLLSHHSQLLNIFNSSFRYAISSYNRMFAVDSLGYFGEVQITWLLYALLILFLITVVVDRREFDIRAYSWINKAYSVVFYFGMAFAIVLSFYIVATPVGIPDIYGVQPRYLLPLYYPLVAMIAPGHKKWKIREVVGCTAIGIDVFLSIYGIVALM